MSLSSDLNLPLRIIERHNQVIKKATSKQAKQRVSRSIFEGLRQGFYARTDARARSNRMAYHHLYEWGATGEGSARLFKLTSMNRGQDTFMISYDFLDSTAPVPTGGTHVFAKKAMVMEEGAPVVIAPVSGEFLFFEVDGRDVFTNKPVTVDSPGGPETKGTLRDDFMYYFRPSVLAKNPIHNAIVEKEIAKTLGELKRN